MTTLLQIVPRRLPGPEGVGDFANRLANVLASDYGIGSLFLVGDPAAPLREDQWPTCSIPMRRADAFADEIARLVERHGCSALLVHVSLYGYQKRATPFWLVTGLERLKARRPDLRLMIYFHELWVFGDLSRPRPWNSSYWLRFLQRALILRLARVACWIGTNTITYKQRLRAAGISHVPVHVLEVFSNIGEPEEVSQIAIRAARLAVFGSRGTERLYHAHRNVLEALLESAWIEEVVDIGPRDGGVPEQIGGRKVSCLGQLDAAPLSEALLSCRLGILPYGRIEVLGKSGILAAYIAHGVVPVGLDDPGPDIANFAAGANLLTPRMIGPGVDQLEQMQARNLAWYRSHSSSEHGRLVATAIADGLVPGREQAASANAQRGAS